MIELSGKTAVIVLNWNKPEMTVECLESLRTMEGEYDVFVIDNGSDENKRNKLVDEMKKRNAIVLTEKNLDNFKLNDKEKQLLLLILLDKNYGYAKGNNYGLKLAYKLGYEYSLISNNDVKIIDKNVLIELIKGIESDEKYAWAGPRVIGLDGKQQGPFCRQSIWQYALEGGILYPFLYKARIEREHECQEGYMRSDWPAGSFFLMKTHNGAEVGFFDENTFLYSEEAILAEKLIGKSYKFAYVKSTKVLHAHAKTTTDLFRSDLKKFLFMINSDMYYFRKFRGYGDFACTFAKGSRIFYYLVYYPLVKVIKNLRKKRKTQ